MKKESNEDKFKVSCGSPAHAKLLPHLPMPVHLTSLVYPSPPSLLHLLPQPPNIHLHCHKVNEQKWICRSNYFKISFLPLMRMRQNTSLASSSNAFHQRHAINALVEKKIMQKTSALAAASPSPASPVRSHQPWPEIPVADAESLDAKLWDKCCKI